MPKIHAKWVIDEYAKILRKEVWINPPTEPTKADKVAYKVTIFCVIVYLSKKKTKISGPIFCSVVKIANKGQDRPSTTAGIHWWDGAAPLFSSSLVVNISVTAVGILTKLTEKMIKIEAKAWIKKYFKADSVEYLFFFLMINGIKDKRLISNPSQAPIQEFAEIVITIELISDTIKIRVEGWINNEKRQGHKRGMGPPAWLAYLLIVKV